MNGDSQEGQGGASNNYNPSARRPIHSYNLTEMGRYGLDKAQKENRANSPTNDEQGTDEVDNVQSKMQRQMSPLSIRKKKIHRSNSYSQDEENTTDDDDSEEEPNRSAASQSKSRFEDSHHSQAMNWSHQSNEQQRPLSQRKLSFSSPSKSAKQESKTPICLIITIVIGAIAVILVKSSTFKYLYDNHQDQTTQTNNYGDVLFENNMNNLKEKYNIDSNSILKLKSGISTIFSRMDVGSFVFVYNSHTNNFNPLQFEKFINEVAYTAARYLRHEISSIKHTVMSSDLDMQDHGELISRYRDAVDKTGVLLVKDVDRIPSDLAMAFHYYCDEYDPLVKRSAIFFTLDLANCSNSGEKKSTHDFVEKCLAGKWKTVPQENIRPLLTRVVNVIIDVTRVF